MTELQKNRRQRRTLLPWMGGKSKLADHIISRLPGHKTYVEAFCGGCAVFFRKPRSTAEILNDADNRLITLFRVFRHHPDELLRELAGMTHSRQEFRDALSQPGITDIQRAARFLLVIKAGYGAKISSPSFGYSLIGKAKFNLADVSTLISAARERLDGVTIENLDFEEVITRYDSPETLFYCDPPYMGTAGYACKFTMDDHARLHRTLSAIRGKAVISLNDCPEVHALWDGWKFESLTTTYSVGGKHADLCERRDEVLISNTASI